MKDRGADVAALQAGTCELLNRTQRSPIGFRELFATGQQCGKRGVGWGCHRDGPVTRGYGLFSFRFQLNIGLIVPFINDGKNSSTTFPNPSATLSAGTPPPAEPEC